MANKRKAAYLGYKHNIVGRNAPKSIYNSLKSYETLYMFPTFRQLFIEILFVTKSVSLY